VLGYSIQERKEVKKRMLNNNHHTLAEDLLKKSARQDKRNYNENKAKEAEKGAKENDSRKLYNITRSLW